MAGTNTLTTGADFGALLRQLRRRAGLTQGELAATVGFSAAQISRLEKNARLPDVTQIIEQFVPALLLDEEPHLAQRLVELAAAARGVSTAGQTGIRRTVQVSVREEPVTVEHDLPLPPTTLVGRKRTIAAVTNRLLSVPGRLLTLVGPPGVGKSRIALAVATEVQTLFANGAYFVPLATATSAEELLQTIFQTLQISKRDPDGLRQLVGHLRRRELLLVLDSFEQLLTAAPVIASLLAQAAQLRILVTSREPLRLRAEQRFLIEPLEPAAAVELFTQRAQAVDPAFALNAQNSAQVALLCLELDCLPLALELVAARTELFQPAQLLERLHADGLAILSDGPRDLPPRHQTLRNAIEWSYALLSQPQQQLFSLLGVFSGGFDAAAVNAVALLPDARDQQATGALQPLVAGNLVKVQTTSTPIRFALLATIHAYAAELLATRADYGVICQRHAGYFLAVAESAARAMSEGDPAPALETLQREQDNLRAALRWLLHHDPAAALRLAVALGDFWTVRGYQHEARNWLEQALAQSVVVAPQRIAALRLAAEMARHQGDYSRAETLLAECIPVTAARHNAPATDARLAAQVLQSLGWLAFDRHDRAGACDYFARARQLIDRAADPILFADLLVATVHATVFMPATQTELVALLQEALTIFRQHNHAAGVAHALQKVGEFAVATGEYNSALNSYREVEGIWRKLGDVNKLAWTLALLGEAHWLTDALAAAQNFYTEARQLFLRTGNLDGEMIVLHHQGQVSRRRGELAAAQHLYEQSLALAETLSNRHMRARCLFGLASVAARAGDAGRAQELLLQAESLFAQLPPFLAPADQQEYDGFRHQLLFPAGDPPAAPDA